MFSWKVRLLCQHICNSDYDTIHVWNKSKTVLELFFITIREHLSYCITRKVHLTWPEFDVWNQHPISEMMYLDILTLLQNSCYTMSQSCIQDIWYFRKSTVGLLTTEFTSTMQRWISPKVCNTGQIIIIPSM